MDQMLHRGRYAVDFDSNAPEPMKKRFNWDRLIGIDEHFTRKDRILSRVTFFWGIGQQVLNVGIVLWWVFVGRLSDSWWFNWMLVTAIWIPLVIAVITTVWFTIGTTGDILDLLKTLRRARRNDLDDGTVRNHHNLGEPPSIQEKAPVA